MKPQRTDRYEYEPGSTKPVNLKDHPATGEKLPKRPKRDTGARYVDRKPKKEEPRA